MASFSVLCPKSTGFPQYSSISKWRRHGLHQSGNISFHLCPNSRHSSSKIVAESSSNSALVTQPQASSISTFINEVSVLIKMVDSRDIVEVQLQQHGCELIIRKKEALPQPEAPPVMTMPPPQYAFPPQPPPSQISPPAMAASPPTPPTSAPVAALPAPPKSSSSSHPPLKCPMAGTFYRCPAPGEPPFVKVGGKVQKGQVICIIEAMKLMNEIEADQSGTIAEILVEDGKPVSVDLPLFVIVP